jgi:hypothetical protein
MNRQRVEDRHELASHPGRKSGGDHEITWSSAEQPAKGHKSACVRMILSLRQLTSEDGNNRICRPEQNAIRRLVEIGLGTAGLKRKGTK